MQYENNEVRFFNAINGDGDVVLTDVAVAPTFGIIAPDDRWAAVCVGSSLRLYRLVEFEPTYRFAVSNVTTEDNIAFSLDGKHAALVVNMANVVLIDLNDLDRAIADHLTDDGVEHQQPHGGDWPHLILEAGGGGFGMTPDWIRDIIIQLPVGGATSIYRCSFSPDSKLLLTTTNHVIRFWDAYTGAPLGSLRLCFVTPSWDRLTSTFFLAHDDDVSDDY